jgi:hypothetical protein
MFCRYGFISIPQSLLTVTWLGLGVGFSVVATGCVGPTETRFLGLNARPPATERRAYELHDPFADKLVGPDTEVRPRGFSEPREEPRRAYDLRNIQSTAGIAEPTGPEGVRVPATRPGVAPPSPVANLVIENRPGAIAAGGRNSGSPF